MSKPTPAAQSAVTTYPQFNASHADLRGWCDYVYLQPNPQTSIRIYAARLLDLMPAALDLLTTPPGADPRPHERQSIEPSAKAENTPAEGHGEAKGEAGPDVDPAARANLAEFIEAFQPDDAKDRREFGVFSNSLLRRVAARPDSQTTAPDILTQAAAALRQRATERDQPTGERTMGRIVAAFNALHGTQLTEVQGWQFMELLKIARSTAGRHQIDDYIDGAAYAALAGEAAERAAANP